MTEFDENKNETVVVKAQPGKKQKHKVCRISRNSGMRSGMSSTFGGAKRFGSANDPLSTPGAKSSPTGDRFYNSSPYKTKENERGPAYGLGFGERPPMLMSSTGKYVAPGTYKPVVSNCKARSPLDGPEFCVATMKMRTKILGPGGGQETDVPGPGTYNETNRIGVGKPAFSLGMSFNSLLDNKSDKFEQPAALGDTETIEKPLRASFTKQKRFNEAFPSQSPNGNQYYNHIRIWNANDYQKMSRYSTLGRGQRVDFAKLSSGARSKAGPGSYDPITSACKATSALDGWKVVVLPKNKMARSPAP